MDVEKIVREYIDKSVHMSLGTSQNNKPWVCEVHFVYDDQLNLYFRSLKSRRHSQEIAQNPDVAGNIVKQHALNEYPHAIYFEGEAAIIDDEQERQKLFPLFQSRLTADEDIFRRSPTGRWSSILQNYRVKLVRLRKVWSNLWPKIRTGMEPGEK